MKNGLHLTANQVKQLHGALIFLLRAGDMPHTRQDFWDDYDIGVELGERFCEDISLEIPLRASNEEEDE